MRSRARVGEHVGGVVKLLWCDVRVAGHRREVGVPEVLGDEAGVASALALPSRRGVAHRVGSDALVEPSALGGPMDGVCEDRRLELATGESAHRLARQRIAQPA